MPEALQSSGKWLRYRIQSPSLGKLPWQNLRHFLPSLRCCALWSIQQQAQVVEPRQGESAPSGMSCASVHVCLQPCTPAQKPHTHLQCFQCQQCVKHCLTCSFCLQQAQKEGMGGILALGGSIKLSIVAVAFQHIGLSLARKKKLVQFLLCRM